MAEPRPPTRSSASARRRATCAAPRARRASCSSTSAASPCRRRARRCSSRRAPPRATSSPCSSRPPRTPRRTTSSSPDELRIEEAYADEGPTLKRWQPRARGRAMRIRKRTCHLTVVLRHDPSLAEAAAREGGGRRGAAARATIEATQRARRTGKAVAPEAAVETDEPVDADEAVEEAPEAEATPPAKAAPPRHRGGRRGAGRRRGRSRGSRRRRRGRERRRAHAEGGGGLDGPEDPSRRAPRRHHPRLEVHLVLRARLRRVPGRGHSHPRAHPRQAVARRALRHPHPQGQAADHDRHLHGTSRHRDRQVRQRGRRAAPRRARHDVQGRADQHQRDQAARARRQAGRAGGRRAAPEPRVVPARDEALARLGDPLGRAGRQDPVRRPSRRLRDVALRAVLGGSRAAAHAARRHRLRLLPGEDHVRRDRRQGLDQQGRDHARGLRGPRGPDDAPR